MAIAFNNIAVNPANASSFVTGGNDRLMFYGIQGGTAAAVSYGGVALTKLIDILDSSGAGFQLWYLVGPAIGSNTFNTNSSGARHFLVSYNGVLQTGFPDSSANSNTSADPKSLNTTTVLNNSWVVAFAANAGGTASATGPLVSRSTGADAISIWADSGVPISPAGIYTSTIDFASAGTNAAICAVSFGPAPENLLDDRAYFM